MKVHRWEEIEREEMSPEIGREVIHTSRMTTARIFLKQGAVVARHSHDNEQVSHVLEGRLRFEFGEEHVVVGPGEIVEIPPDQPHRVLALEDTVGMDVFAPVRQDWILGEDAYLRTPHGES
jgi:quercetin dioxygenase-like cupin family protein